MSTESFAGLGVSRAVIGSLASAAITEPFAIQRAVIGDAIAGRDVIAKSPTGSGKTLAFGIPLVERIRAEDPRPAGLVLAPTRELATQIVDDIRGVARVRALRVTAVYGGVGLVKQAKDAASSHDAGRDPRTARGPARTRRIHARQRQDADPRRGRPDARHGLSSGDRPDRRRLSRGASDAVLLRHPRRRSRADCRALRPRPGDPSARADRPARKRGDRAQVRACRARAPSRCARQGTRSRS